MRKLAFLVLLIITSVSLFGCNSSEETRIEIPEESVPLSPFGEFEQIGTIIGFEPGIVKLLYNGKLLTYPLASTHQPGFYLGETVGVTRIEDELMMDENVFALTSIIAPDTQIRETAMGETIHQLHGFVETVNKNNFSIQSGEELIWIETYDNQDLVEGAQMLIDYLNWGDHFMMVHCYNETLRILFTITEKNRSEEGHLILTGTTEDESTLSIQLSTSTVINFSHASLKIGDTLAVYPQRETEQKELILPKRVDRIQFRTYRTKTEPILQ